MVKVGSYNPMPLAGMAFLLAFLPLAAKSQTVDDSGPQPIEYVIEDVQGPNVQVMEEGQGQWEPAQEGQVLESGDEIRTGAGSQANLMMQSETSVHLNELTDMKVDQIASNPDGGFLSRLKVLAGMVLADVKKNLQESHSSFEVESNGVICGVRGTAFEVNAQTDGTAQILTHEGKVEVANGGETHMVTAGNFSSFYRGHLRSQRVLDRMEVQRFQRWRAFRQNLYRKHSQRLADIRMHRRAVWHRRHPHPNRKDRRREEEQPRHRRPL